MRVLSSPAYSHIPDRLAPFLFLPHNNPKKDFPQKTHEPQTYKKKRCSAKARIPHPFWYRKTVLKSSYYYSRSKPPMSSLSQTQTIIFLITYKKTKKKYQLACPQLSGPPPRQELLQTPSPSQHPILTNMFTPRRRSATPSSHQRSPHEFLQNSCGTPCHQLQTNQPANPSSAAVSFPAASLVHCKPETLTHYTTVFPSPRPSPLALDTTPRAKLLVSRS